MDFYTIKARSAKNGVTEVYPDFKICRSKDLMVRGKSFYAIWDEKQGLWSTDEYDVQRLIDEDLRAYADDLRQKVEGTVSVKYLGEFSSNTWMQFRTYINHLSDSSRQLDEKITFLNSDVRKEDYVSRRLPYSLHGGETPAYDRLIGVLYDPQEREKLEWAIGAIVSGDSREIQKFVVLYGSAGAGKSTVLSIIERLFDGYYTTFEAKALTGANNSFATESFRGNPLVAIQHDGDLSRIDDNTKLNSIVSHEMMAMNEKYKPTYTSRINAFLFMGTNKPVKITDAKSGLIRRLIDVKPSGRKLPIHEYFATLSQIQFELGAIAAHCLEVYRSLGRDYYSNYRPLDMMYQTDSFFNFIEMYYDVFSKQNGTSLSQAYDMFKQYVADSGMDYTLTRHRFREELKNYFGSFEERVYVDGVHIRSWYSDFKKEIFTQRKPPEKALPLKLDHSFSILDDILASYPAQYASEAKTPILRWVNVHTTLNDLDTSCLHYVKVPENHIVIDFDIRNDDGEKDEILNLEAASQWPATYSEYSQGGKGIHLHYIYDGDPSQLARVYGEGIEVKVFSGDSSLRRRLTLCNNTDITHISDGLPLKEKHVIDFDIVRSEKGLRNLIIRNLNKEIHPGTKPSIDFIHKILDDAYSQGLPYDVSDMRGAVLTFALGSTNQSEYCVKRVASMKFTSDVEERIADEGPEQPLAFYDVECFPNLFVICWKFAGEEMVHSMVNPSPQEVEYLFKLRLVGFNVRHYDNHMLYAAHMGYTNEQLYRLSQAIINNEPDSKFLEAYNISYTDVWDFSANKQSLKKSQIELGIHHLELGLPWDQPVAEDKIASVVEYCKNDVISLEAVFESRRGDFVARQILADLSGLTVNDTTNRHTTRIVFGNERKPQKDFNYPDLSKEFPGYNYSFGESTYRGEITGEGGLVRAKPGMYRNVAVLDVASMHPTSIEVMNLFGPYTKNFSELKQARVYIKHGDFIRAGEMMNGRLSKYLTDPTTAKDLSNALKIAINSVYGLTNARFDNPFKDNRNVDNVVAKRGALFMVDLMKAVEEQGFDVIHIKTDSIKIPNAIPSIIDFVMEFGRRYGYEFEHEETYEKMCLVNDAVYVAMKQDGSWTATGAQFQHPYVFKTLFTHEPLVFDDLCETKAVTTALYLDFNENLPDGEHDRKFIGRVGRFTPVQPGADGGLLVREKDGAYHYATGAKGHRWLESEVVQTLGLSDSVVDVSYFNGLVNDAVENISQYGDLEWFISEREDGPPWEEN